jgi:chitodextrinase
MVEPSMWNSRLLVGLIAAAIALGGASATAHAADPVIAAAGDIACDPNDGNFKAGNGTDTACRQKYTSDLLVNAGLAQVITLGDNQYDSFQADKVAASYHPSWGRVKSITRPGIGNHEPGSATDYFDYFNGVGVNDGPAGERGKAYYSFDVGSWHVIALNSNCSTVACNAGSPQEQWLRADLAAHPSACTLAFWHHPRFSSGHDGDNTFTQPFWKALYDADADVVLVGHSHDYERFAPQDANGNRDTTRGIRQFVVGTGGAFFTGISTAKPNSEVRQNNTYGVLKLTLHPTSYDWQFVPASGPTNFTDSGSEACHGGGGPPDTQAPTAPTNLSGTASSSGRVNLSWNASSDNVGVTGYEVFRNGSLIGTASGTTYSDTTVNGGISYTYQVKARDAAGNRSGFSNSATITTPPGATIPAQADARVTEAAPSTNYATSFLRTDGAADPDVESYLRFDVTGLSGTVESAKLRVYAYTDTNNGPAVFTTTNSWSETGITWSNRPGATSAAHDDKGAIVAGSWVEFDVTPFVSGNGTYSFKLATTSADGVDMYSREAADTSLRPELVLSLTGGGSDTEAPSTPSGLSAVAPSPTRVDLSWTASTDDVGVTGYEVFRNGALVGTSTGTSYSDATVSPNTAYTYTVKAKDAAGNRSVASNSASVTTPPDTQAPTAPANLTAVAGSGPRVDLSWNASTDNVGVTGYEVFRGGALVGTATGTSYSDGTVTPGSTYSYQVSARDAAGNRSGFSNTATLTTPFIFAAQADAHVKQANPSSNYGWEPSLTVDASPVFESYVTFTVANVSGAVRSAKLRLHAYNGSSDGPALYTTSSGWAETGISGITWNTRPAATSGVLGDKGKVTTGTWVEYDVSSVVQGNGTYSFLLRNTNSNDVRFNSREASTLRPELALTVG